MDKNIPKKRLGFFGNIWRQIKYLIPRYRV